MQHTIQNYSRLNNTESEVINMKAVRFEGKIVNLETLQWSRITLVMKSKHQ